MTDLVGCMVEGCGWKGRVRAVTYDVNGNLICWILPEDDNTLRRVHGYITVLEEPKRPEPIAMPIPRGGR